MKFGAVAPDQAIGAVLAHSVALSGRARLRKGHVLTKEDADALHVAGYAMVTVARLESGDVHEDAAAAMLAKSIVPDPQGQRLELSAAFTGRVNVIAAGPGIVDLDSAAIDAVNAIDPMITVATVPQWHQMAPGGMVATIKIISYAVPETALAEACAVAQKALRVRGPAITSVRLVISEIDGGARDKGWRAIADRVAAFGLEMAPPVLVPHDVDALSAALSESAADLTLVLTGSATSDGNDVAPAALRAAGGHVARFGMPVDPGNLLFIGTLGQGTVIGLPGCARSPALNGADWVMGRVICGLDVSAGDIARMGVGGLLKEIPTRPHPRRTRPAT